MNTLVADYIQKEMTRLGDEKVRQSTKRFFKEAVKVHGIPSKIGKMIGKEAEKMVESLTKEELFANCEELYKSGYCEEGWSAAALSYQKHDEFIESDFEIFEKWVNNYVDDWAKCDTLCNHTIASVVDNYPQKCFRLKFR